MHTMSVLPAPQEPAPTRSARDLREAIVRRSLPIVRQMALRLARRAPAHVELDDLVSSGTEGLLQAIESFDAARSASFEPYARRRIHGAMLDELRRHDPLTRTERRRARSVARARVRVEQTLGRAARQSEVVGATTLDLEAYRQSVLATTTVPDPTRPLEPELLASPQASPARELEQAELRRCLVHAIQRLPTKWIEALSLHYQHELRQTEIARVLEVTPSRVCQILSQALRALQDDLERQGLDADHLFSRGAE